jgi:hypothetical protein
MNPKNQNIMLLTRFLKTMKIETNISLRGIIAAGDFFYKNKKYCLFRETLNGSQARHAIEDKLIKKCGMSEDKTGEVN